MTLYIGSYGNSDESIRLNFGRLKIILKRNLFLWKIGLCKIHSEAISINHNIIVILFGSLASLSITIVCGYLAFFIEISDEYRFLAFIFMLSSLHDFFVDIVPSNEAIRLDEDTFIYNDGQQIKTLLKFRNLPEEYDEGVKYYNVKEYGKAAILFKKTIDLGAKRDFIYRLAISSFLQIKDYQQASLINNDYNKKCKKDFDSDDYSNSGLIKSF